MNGWARTKLKKTGRSWILERRMYIQTDRLIYDFNSCNGCDFCSTTCPKEALSIKSPKPTLETDPRDFELKIDVDLCIFCGCCVSACVYNSIFLEVNGEKTIPVEEKEVFPRMTPDFDFDPERAKTFCVACSSCYSSCPRQGIIIKFIDGVPKVEWDLEKCSGCHTCEVSCPSNVIITNTPFKGLMEVNNETCVDECTKCIDICPMEALSKDNPCEPENNQLNWIEQACTYCGACVRVCPTNPKSLTMQRQQMREFFKEDRLVESGVLTRAQNLLTKPKS